MPYRRDRNRGRVGEWAIYLRVTAEGHYIGLTNAIGRRRREHRSRTDPAAELYVLRRGIGSRAEADWWERHYLRKLVELAARRPELGIRVLNRRRLPKSRGSGGHGS